MSKNYRGAPEPVATTLAATPGTEATIQPMAHKRTERSIPIDPLPSTQEPYVRLIAPNLDRVSRATFRRGTIEGRRAKRGLIVLAIVVVLAAVVAIVGVLISAH
jgi:hypothetical protein